jgi:hypothetical protein
VALTACLLVGAGFAWSRRVPSPLVSSRSLRRTVPARLRVRHAGAHLWSRTFSTDQPMNSAISSSMYSAWRSSHPTPRSSCRECRRSRGEVQAPTRSGRCGTTCRRDRVGQSSRRDPQGHRRRGRVVHRCASRGSPMSPALSGRRRQCDDLGVDPRRGASERSGSGWWVPTLCLRHLTRPQPPRYGRVTHRSSRQVAGARTKDVPACDGFGVRLCWSCHASGVTGV